MQSPHCVQRSRNAASSPDPGGRSQSVRTAAGFWGGGASTSRENSRAAFATERTESLKKSRRPYEGSVAIDLKVEVKVQAEIEDEATVKTLGIESLALTSTLTYHILRHPVGTQLIDLHTAIASPEFHIPSRMVFSNKVQHIRLNLVGHIFNP